MKLTGKRKYICFLLILMMLVSGMCFDTVKADACFLSDKAPYQSGFAYTNKNTVTKQYAFVEENVEKIEVVSRTVVRGSKQRETRGRHFNHDVALLQEAVSEASLLSSHVAAYFIRSEYTSSAVIIRYVHHQDGSKG